MIVEIKVPSVGESVAEAILAEWFKKDGDIVKKGEALFVIETDKVTLEVESEAAGKLKILVAEGETVVIGAVVGNIDADAAEAESAPPEPPAADKAEPPPAETEAPPPEPAQPAPPVPVVEAEQPQPAVPVDLGLSPAVRRLVAQTGVDVSQIIGTGPGGRVTKGDVLLYLEQAPVVKAPAVPAARAAEIPAVTAPSEQTSRKPMTPIRQRIAARLLEAKQGTAMLTTFNDIDMSRVMDMRSQYKESFQKKFGVSLGFMSFFIKASVEALKEIPEINAFIDGKEIVYHHYYHVGVAIGTGRGVGCTGDPQL